MTRLLALLLSVVAVACVPTVDGHEAELSTPRVIAVRADPPEVGEGESTTFTALYADASGELTTAPIDWAYCLIRKPLAELGAVASGCVALQGTSDQFTDFGNGITATGSMPSDACTLFGPNPPPATATMPSGRPVDPDVTGGYMQPLRLLVTEQDGSVTPVIAQQRLVCNPAGATQEQQLEFKSRYRRNGAPTIESLQLVRGNDAFDLGDTPLVVSPGELLTLRVAWPKCPETADVCGDHLCGIDEDATCADCDPTKTPSPTYSCP